MNQLITVLAILALLFSGNITRYDEAQVTVIGGADGPTEIYMSENVDETSEAEAMYFTRIAEKEDGGSIRLVYAHIGEENYLLAVEDDGKVYSTGVADIDILDGIATSIDEAEHSVTLDTTRLGEVIVMIPQDMAMPVQDEHVCVYTDGMMTKSLPGITHAVAWESVPDESAR